MRLQLQNRACPNNESIRESRTVDGQKVERGEEKGNVTVSKRGQIRALESDKIMVVGFVPNILKVLKPVLRNGY